jgi:hypothetical protein
MNFLDFLLCGVCLLDIYGNKKLENEHLCIVHHSLSSLALAVKCSHMRKGKGEF